MKIESIKVSTTGAGTRIEVGFLVASNEELEESDIMRMYDALKELAGQVEHPPVRTIADAMATAECQQPEAEPEKPAAAEPVLGRRRRSPVAEAAAAVEQSQPQAEAPAGRRRRAAPTAQENPTQSTGADTSSAPLSEPQGRRRRTAAEPATTTATAAEPATTISEAGRRRRNVASATTTTTSAPAASPADDIKDADLMKAASEGARVITPKGVMDILTGLGAKGLQELKGGDRRKFLDTVKAKIASAA